MPEQKTQTVMPAFDSASSLHDTWPLYGLSAQVPSVVGQRVSNDQVHTEGAGPNLRGIGDRMKSRSPVLSMSTFSRLRWLHCVQSPDACLRASDQGSQGRASAASNFPLSVHAGARGSVARLQPQHRAPGGMYTAARGGGVVVVVVVVGDAGVRNKSKSG